MVIGGFRKQDHNCKLKRKRMIAEKGFVEKGIEQAELDVISHPVFSKLLKDNEDRLDMLSFEYWKSQDKGFLIHLERLFQYYLGLYPDGSGYVIYRAKEKLIIGYFVMESSLFEQVKHLISEKVDDIVSHPVWRHEDDRWTIPVHLCFNITHQYPEAYRKLKETQIYEKTIYAEREEEISIVKLLLKDPQIASKWMKMHCYAPIEAGCSNCWANRDRIVYQHTGERARIYCSVCGTIYNENDAAKRGFKDLIKFWNHIGVYMPMEE